MAWAVRSVFFFFFNDTATTEIYTLSLHDALPILSFLTYSSVRPWAKAMKAAVVTRKMPPWFADPQYGHFSKDRKSTRLNSSHDQISYAVFCLQKKRDEWFPAAHA